VVRHPGAGVIRTGHVHGSPGWEAARATLLTASDAPRLLCRGYAKTEEARLQQRAVLLQNKLLGVDMEDFDEPTLEKFEIARTLEPAVIDYARRIMGWEIERNEELCIDSLCQRLGATVDAVRVLDGVEYDIEIKCTQAQLPERCKPGSDAAFAEGPPMYWQIQNVAQMAVSGRRGGFLLVLHHGQGLAIRAYPVPRNDLLIARIRAETERLWDDVERLRAAEVAQ
jgi:predicted phage-related endonuclease